MRRLIIALVGLAACGTSRPVDPPFPEQELAITQRTFSRGGDDKDPDFFVKKEEGKPAEEWLAFTTTAYSPHYDIYFKKIDGTTLQRLTTTEDADERFPRVNPAYPRTVAFCSNREGEWDIYVIEDFELDAAKWIRVSEPETQDIHPSWSPDGTKLVWCSTEEFGTGTWTLKVFDFISRKLQVFEGVDGLLPEWNPVRDTIVFQRMEHRDRWFGSLWTIDYENGVVKNATAIYTGDEWAAINPSWDPTGTRIVFATVAKSKARAGVLDEADDIWVVDRDGSRPTRLTTDAAADWMPVWAREDLILFVSKRGGTNHIWSLSPKLLPR